MLGELSYEEAAEVNKNNLPLHQYELLRQPINKHVNPKPATPVELLCGFTRQLPGVNVHTVPA